jgi:choline dehydrogenase
MVEGLKLIRRIAAAPPLRDYVHSEYKPGAEVQGDDALLGYCRDTGVTVFHPTSTCSIGEVVDEKLRVKGIDGLRVVDASVMPAVTSGNINAAVIAVAEKAADLIREAA